MSATFRQVAVRTVRRTATPRVFRLASLLAWLKAVVARLGFGWGHNLKLGDAYRLGSTKVRVPLDGLSIEISLGLNEKRLHLYPETRLNPRGEPVPLESFVIVDPSAHRRRISGFLRLTQNGWLWARPTRCSRRFSSIRRQLPSSIWSSFMVGMHWSFAI